MRTQLLVAAALLAVAFVPLATLTDTATALDTHVARLAYRYGVNGTEAPEDAIKIYVVYTDAATGGYRVDRFIGNQTYLLRDEFRMTTQGLDASTGKPVGFWWPNAGSTIALDGVTGTRVSQTLTSSTYEFSPGAVGTFERWVLNAQQHVSSIRADRADGTRIDVKLVAVSPALDLLMATADPRTSATGSPTPSSTDGFSGDADYDWPCANGFQTRHFSTDVTGVDAFSYRYTEANDGCSRYGVMAKAMALPFVSVESKVFGSYFAKGDGQWGPSGVNALFVTDLILDGSASVWGFDYNGNPSYSCDGHAIVDLRLDLWTYNNNRRYTVEHNVVTHTQRGSTTTISGQPHTMSAWANDHNGWFRWELALEVDLRATNTAFFDGTNCIAHVTGNYAGDHFLVDIESFQGRSVTLP